MSTATPTRDVRHAGPGRARDRPRGGVALVVLVGAAALLAAAAAHLTQGTAAVGLPELLGVLTGAGTDQQAAVLVASRLPRLAAGVLVGVALGAAGAALQSATRNVLASPDTLAVDAGAYASVVAVATLGVALPAFLGGGVAFLGGLAAAAVVLVLGGAGGTGTPVRLVLAGSAIALGLASVTQALLLLNPERLQGLYAWGGGSIAQTSLQGVQRFGPVVLVAVLLLVLLARRLDLLGLGDDASRLAGLDPRTTRVAAVVLAVLLSACSVSVAGPIGFVGLAAPAAVRLLSSRVRGLGRHRALIPVAALTGAVVVIGADVVLRAVLGAQAGVEVPTGTITTVVGALVLVVLAVRMSDSGLVSAGDALARLRSRVRVRATIAVLAAVLVALVIGGLLLGDVRLLTGDVAAWLSGRSGPVVTAVLDSRAPRVLAALLAGAALALAGTVVQAVSRNSLADPALLGVSGGAGLAAVIVITVVPLASAWSVSGAALGGAALASALVFSLAARGGLQQQRLVLVGIGCAAALAALITIVLVTTDPFAQAKALTWLSGSTYGRRFPSVLPVLVALLVAAPLLAVLRRPIDLLAVDDDTPRVLGLPLGSTRLLLLGAAVLLTGTAVAAVGVVAFVGLVAPHAARALVGARHAAVLPAAALLGGALVVLADAVGRTAIAPDQLPAGVTTALVGAPYFVSLLWRSRADRA